MHQCAKFRVDCMNSCGDMAVLPIFQNGGRPPSWICFTCIWTTYEKHLLVFVTVQNLVGMEQWFR